LNPTRKREIDAAIAAEIASAAVVLSGAALIIALLPILLRLGLSRPSAVWLCDLVVSQRPTVESPLATRGPCELIEEEQAAGWTALFIIAAADRLMTAEAATVPGSVRPGAATPPVPVRPGAANPPGSGTSRSIFGIDAAKVREQRYYEQHVEAEERRMRMALMQDAAAGIVAQDALLGWYAVPDASTTPECRYANGRSFKADQMPAIGWPGAVHMRCRCHAGPPRPGAPLLPSV